MIAIPLGAARPDEALRAVRALGAHRYVASRLHLVHAFAFFALCDGTHTVLPGAGSPLFDGCSWAADLLGGGRDIDPASRDERLWRRSSEAEIVAVLEGFWSGSRAAVTARERLRAMLDRHHLAPADHRAFDEAVETQIHPLLIDAGWELLKLSELDADKHKGAIAAFGAPILFDSVRFEEETAIPPSTHLYELPAIGPVELLNGVGGDGALVSPLVVWADGNETYIDYVIRGVRRAAKLV